MRKGTAFPKADERCMREVSVHNLRGGGNPRKAPSRGERIGVRYLGGHGYHCLLDRRTVPHFDEFRMADDAPSDPTIAHGRKRRDRALSLLSRCGAARTHAGGHGVAYLGSAVGTKGGLPWPYTMHTPGRSSGDRCTW